MAEFGFHPDPASIALDNLLANCQSDACSRNVSAMKALEHSKDDWVMLRGDSDAVIFYREEPFRVRQ